jgi:uncharacterized membrane protein YgdD (TMEM256/DUF423 family)
VTSLEEILRWISGNEALLSGIAALIAIGGLVVSPIGGVLLIAGWATFAWRVARS